MNNPPEIMHAEKWVKIYLYLNLCVRWKVTMRFLSAYENFRENLEMID